ncbi:MAG: hypothetical protein BM564_09055 [Bacteroidetes bacterium MedPE-SWsnd-G2]|nr:MAG: hypothetical protein BM564_09055 [Bacteroidetes bacterium MedPE-SWsnd-G2]
MKKVVLSCLFGFLVMFSVQSQDIAENAIGLRLGDSDGFGAEITYQRFIANNNRVEFDLGWRSGNNSDGFKLAALYQWVWLLDGSFNWYAGVGGGLTSYNFDNVPAGQDDSDTFVFVAGDIGIEYSFDIPLLLSLDFRPEIGFGSDAFDNNDLDFDIGIGVKYQF